MKEFSHHATIDAIISHMFASEKKRHALWIDRIASDNQAISGHHVIGFLYQGEYFRPSTYPTGAVEKHPISPNLYPEIESFLADRRNTDFDENQIRQILFKLLRPCLCYQEMRDALPDCLVNLIPELSSLGRTRPAAFTIEGDERSLRQYDKILPKMELYAVSRLIY